MADKKITELPYIDTLSGSLVGTNSPLQNTVIPLVLRGTTNQINIENFSKFVTAYSATTASNHFKADQFITGSLTVTGKITAEEFHTEITSASIIYQSGSSKFGDSAEDVMTVTGTILLNGSAIGLQQLNAQTSSQNLINLAVSSITGSINTTTSSFDSVFLRISSTTGSINTTTSSFNSVFLGISSVTGAINTQSSSQDLVNRQISLVSGSIHFTTGALNAFTGSIIGQTNTISTFTSSVNFATQSLNTQTGSQNSLNTSLGLITSSIYGEIAAFNNVFSGVSNISGAFAVEFGSIQKHILSQAVQTSSQDLVNLGISSVTGSLIGITNTLMGFTASLDNTYATDAQLYQLYEATASIHSATASLNTQTGSQSNLNAQIGIATSSLNSVSASLIGITNGLMAFTASLDNTFATDAQLLPLMQATASIHSATASLNAQTGSQNNLNAEIGIATSSLNSVSASLIGITNGLMAFTAALDTTYATDVQLYQLYQATASIHFTTESLNTQTGSQQNLNARIGIATSSLNFTSGSINTFTGSIRSEVNLIEEYTASLKGAIEVSGQNVNVLGMITAQQFNVTYVSSSVMYQSGSNKFGNSSDDRHEFTGSLFVSGSTIILKNTGAQSADFVADRPSTSLGATYGYNTAGVNKWYTGLRGLANDNLYIFNNNTSANTVTFNSANDTATFAGSVVAPSFNTLSTTTSIPFTTWTTILNMDGVPGVFAFSVQLDFQDAADWAASGIVMSTGTNSGVTAQYLGTQNDGTYVQTRISGTTLQVFQNGTNPNVTMAIRIFRVA